MITHLVLCTPRSNLTPAEEQSLLAALEHAARTIPTVRRCTVGRRVRHGAGYETVAGTAEFLLLLEFDDLTGLQAYLADPAHEALGHHFRLSLRDAHAFDFETAGLDRVRHIAKA